MSKICITKDIGFGDERKIELDIDLCLSGKADTTVCARLVSRGVKDDFTITADDDHLRFHFADKFDKKSVTSEKGEPLEVAYVPYFVENILKTNKLTNKINAIYKDGNVVPLVYCDLLFIAVLLDSCERSCRSAFPWYIGGMGSVNTQILMLQLMGRRTDFDTKNKIGGDVAKSLAGLGGYYGGAGVATATGLLAADAVAAGGVSLAGAATSAGVVAGAVSSGASALAGGAGLAGAGAAAATTFEAGAAAASAFAGVTVGAVAAPVTLTVAAAGLAIMGIKAVGDSAHNIVLKKNMEVLQKYSELVQRGNIGMYCAKNELRFHEIWTELAEKCEACGATDIFDLEGKIAVLL